MDSSSKPSFLCHGAFFFSPSFRWLAFGVSAGCAIASLWLTFGYPFASDVETDRPLSPQEAASKMIVPDGFQVTLFAGEPDVKQPIGFCIDDRGRLWVAEAYNYPNHGTRPGDRIVILEDTDGDGKFDRRKVFFDQLNYVTGIEVGFGGAWVMSPPYFYFIPDRDGDDLPDGEPQVLLDGFGNHANSHNLANGFAWGPDGWLYGTHGRTNWSRIGKPGTPENQRIQYDGGVYRYHPIRHIWEPYADGTTNPWGIDWNDYGESFVCNCVNPHLFHVLYGAHYEPWRNRESSRFAYERIDTIADHLHFVGTQNVRDGLGSPAEDAAGGGHAHCGTMVYLGDNWPEKYRNTVFMNNIHGKRVNNDLLERKGSGYVAHHGQDIIRSQDPWHMGVTIQYGPDGGVFVSDWSDTGECHSVRNTRRETGRIFKITYGTPKRRDLDIKSLADNELVSLQADRNDWYVRHARRLLQERYAAGKDLSQARVELLAMYDRETDVPRKLRALWGLHAIGGVTDELLIRQLRHESEYVRAWGVRLLCENPQWVQKGYRELQAIALSDPSAYVRLHLASGLQRLPLKDRFEMAEGLISHAEDEEDQNLPRMNWYAIEPLIDADRDRFLGLAKTAKQSMVRRHIARRGASHSDWTQCLETMTKHLIEVDDPAFHRDLLSGILKGLEGRRTAKMPSQWIVAYRRLEASRDRDVRQHAIELALIFDDERALEFLRAQVRDATANVEERRSALKSLLAKKAKGLEDLLLLLLADQGLQREAIRGLAEWKNPETPQRLLKIYPSLEGDARQDALQTLSSRGEWGHRLLDAVESNVVPRKEVTAFTIRQLQSLGDEELLKRVKRSWGEVRSTAADKEKQIAVYRKMLTPSSLQKADLQAGRALFQKSCANCHRLFGTGATLGPEITGAQRTNLDYLLENLVDPSAAVAKDFQMEVLLTESGRIVTGLVIEESDLALTVQTTTEKVVLPKAEIEKRTLSPVSMMPEGMLQQLSNEQIRNLIAYLGSPNQVELPEGLSEGR